MTDKRIADRTPTNLPGHLISQALSVPCTILDLSAAGARLQVRAGLFLPKTLMLRGAGLGEDRPVEVVWRNKTQIGVRF